MTTQTHSADYPQVLRLRGKILYPFDIQAAEAPAEGFFFEYMEIEDTGQEITDSAWISETEYQLKHDKIVAEYEAKLAEGFITSLGFRIDCLEKNENDFHKGLTFLSLSGSSSTVVRDYDNNNHLVSIADYMQICKALGEYTSQLRYQKWLAVDAIKGRE